MAETPEQRESEQRLRYLLDRLAVLEERLRRVENSLVFRFLRWLGGCLAALGLYPKTPPPILDGDYARWIRETELLDRFDSRKKPNPDRHERITVLLNDGPSLDRAVASLLDQRYAQWDLMVLSADAPGWAGGVEASGHSVKVVDHSALKAAIGACASEFIVILGNRVVLEPGAFEAWLAATGPDTTAAYSDWDHIDLSSGKRHSPRFTPDLSPELLRQVAYWGHGFMVRTSQLRAIEWPEEASKLRLEYAVALRLCDRSSSIVRVPRILWHLEAERPEPVQPSAKAVARECTERVSLIICSRNPHLLRRCLRAIRPALQPRHEVVVVGHGAEHAQALRDVTSAEHAKFVPYDAAFHFGLMNALGIAESGGEVICLLNDDVYPKSNAWIDLMLSQAVRPEVGVAGALLEFPDGTIQHAGVAVGGRVLPVHPGRYQRESELWPWLRITREVTAVTGACMMFRRSIWEELGGFDLRFPANFNDVDFCLRARARGYQVLLEAGAVLTHEESKTRISVVEPSEAALFYKLWGHILSVPDPFFNPQLDPASEVIRLTPPWSHKPH